MKVDYGANARVGVHGTPDFVQHRGVSPWCLRSLALRRMPCGPERRVSDPVRWGIPRQSFSFLRSSCLSWGRREEGQSGTLCRLGGPPQDGGTAGCVDVGLVREGFLPLGMGAASAPLDVTASASFPLRGKSVTTSAHLERAARTSTCHPRHAPVARARLRGTVQCVGM